MTNLTKAQFTAIETILAHGGKVRTSMGRKAPGQVNKRLLLDMVELGLVRLWGRGADGYLRSGPARVNVEVRALGCIAFNAAQQQQSC